MAELLLMAAGMGSRFGGLKQAAPLGPNGEIMIDYSVYDAVKAGFDRAIIIIRKDIEKDFREASGKRIEKMIDVEYVFQEKDILPQGYTLPDGRLKPWGTGHAIWCARNAVKKPFVVINCDDYYGQTIYKDMHDYLTETGKMCMAGFKIENTLSEIGTVTRGICKVEDGFLKEVIETEDIPFDTDIPKGTFVSMNMWGLDLGIFDYLDSEFKTFLNANLHAPKTEFYIPKVIDSRVKTQGKTVKVIPTNEKWYGVTYAEDTPKVKAAIAALTAKGLYDGI